MVFNFQGPSSHSSSSIYVYSANSVYPLRLYQFGTIVWLLILLQTEYKCLVAAQGNQGGNNNLRQGYVHIDIVRSFTFMTLQISILCSRCEIIYDYIFNYQMPFPIFTSGHIVQYKAYFSVHYFQEMIDVRSNKEAIIHSNPNNKHCTNKIFNLQMQVLEQMN